METFTKLFGSLLVFVYHCFDRVVIDGYLSGLSRPEQVVFFFREVLGLPVVDKEVLIRRTNNTEAGWRRTPAATNSRWSGAARKCEKKTTCCPLWPGWRRRMLMASISSSRAWSRAGRSGSLCRSIPPVRQKFQIITDRFAGFQAQCLNVHVDFLRLQRLALPIVIGSVRYPGIKIHDTRVIRLLEVLLHGGNTVGGWTAKQIHEAVLTTFQLSPKPTV